jgi:hypothetical protein
MVDDQNDRADRIELRQWTEATAVFEKAEAAYRPIRDAFEFMERHRSTLAKFRDEKPDAEIAQLECQFGEEAISSNEGRYLRLHCAALRTLLVTPAPDLAAVICKLELIRDHDWDEETGPIILADLQRLRARYEARPR